MSIAMMKRQTARHQGLLMKSLGLLLAHRVRTRNIHQA